MQGKALMNALLNESVMDLDLAESDLVLDDEPEITFSDKDLLLSNAETDPFSFVSGDLAGERKKSCPESAVKTRSYP